MNRNSKFVTASPLALATAIILMSVSPAHADETPECNTGPALASLECGIGANATGENGVAVGGLASAGGTSSTAVGPVS